MRSMKEIWDIIIISYRNYIGQGVYFVLFLIALMYIVFVPKEKEKRHLFFLPVAVLTLLIFNPIAAKIVLKMLEGATYWRMFWLLPMILVIAYVLVQFVHQQDKKNMRYFALAMGIITITICGNWIYTEDNFDGHENAFNLPSQVIWVSDIIAPDEGGYAKAVAPEKLNYYIRQYNADIKLAYSRDDAHSYNQGYRGHPIYDQVKNDILDGDLFLKNCLEAKCNYIITDSDWNLSDDKLGEYGYYYIDYVDEYKIYEYKGDIFEAQVRDSKGWVVTQYGGVSGNNLMFYTIQNSSGELVVIDGGWEADADYVRDVICSLGGKVDAWILTHPHMDHIGAFCKLYPNRGSIEIKKVYAVDMASPDLVKANAPWDNASLDEEFRLLDVSNLSYVHKGDVIDLIGLNMTVLSAYDDYVDIYSNDLINDGSMMFKLESNNNSMLFCADVGISLSDFLIEAYGDDLKSDYIQMGHHGYGGPDDRFYKTVKPNVSFFDAPDWLMEDADGKYGTKEKVQLMEEMGSRIYSFSTAPNKVYLR